MVNPWTFPEAIELVNLLKDRYLDFAKLGIFHSTVSFKTFILKELKSSHWPIIKSVSKSWHLVKYQKPRSFTMKVHERFFLLCKTK